MKKWLAGALCALTAAAGAVELKNGSFEEKHPQFSQSRSWKQDIVSG